MRFKPGDKLIKLLSSDTASLYPVDVIEQEIQDIAEDAKAGREAKFKPFCVVNNDITALD